MAEVRKIIAYMNAERDAGFVTDEGLVGGSAYDAHGAAISKGYGRRRLPPMRCSSAPSRTEMGCGAL